MTRNASQQAKPALRIAGQVALLSAVWWMATQMSQHFMPAVPGGVLGMAVVLIGLIKGWLPLDLFKSGARWLLAEMLLFFIPVVVAVVQYPELIVSAGAKILLVIVLSTGLVMTATSLTVDRFYRLELALKRRYRTREA
ncbi:CidA/LrgA family protein [Crenobacter cavernae]|uniref:CidA/LrgA family protein n=2 Tax=Crenobacter cavernae TaxID=2290923 RepID=A0ABY0FHH8_9NEIS|nr:CidA/LrgA family protein [Crenobacter cavernae]